MLPIHDYGHRSAAVGALMLGAAGDVDLGVADQARQRAGDERAGMACRRDIGIIQHAMTMPAQEAIVAHAPKDTFPPLAFILVIRIQGRGR